VADGATVLEEKSSTSCALAAHGGQVLLAWTGSDFRINTLWSPDGRSFQDKQTLAHRSSRTVWVSTGSGTGTSQSTTTEPLAPALTVARRGRFMAWTGTDARLNVWGYDLPDPAQAVLPERTQQPPALAPWGDELAVAWTGSDRRLNVAWTRGGVFGGPQTLAATSGHGPALAPVGGELALAWTGTDRRINVLVTEGGRFGAPLVLGHGSLHGPALCAIDDLLVMAWCGRGRRLHIAALAPGHMGPPVVLGATSVHPPALCAHDGDLLVGWTGTDRRLNIARLPRPG